MYSTLIEPSELAAHGSDPDWTIVDCRFDLARPQWGADAYAAGHIPHAIYAHLDRDLSGRVTCATGRHPLPEYGAFARTLGQWGVDGTVQIVAYDQTNGAFASRLWWLARWIGHTRVAVLNGGFAAWQQAALPVSTDDAPRPARTFVATPTAAGAVTTRELEGWIAAGELNNGRRTLLDARAPDRFAGQNETLDPVAGHVPGARSRPFAGNLDSQGRFLDPATLRQRWLESLQGRPPQQVISMCGSGVTACHNLLALEIAGLSGAKLYAGSWSEWIRDAAHPVERGS